MNTEPLYALRLETLEPIRTVEVFEGEELVVLVYPDHAVISELEAANDPEV